jgi:ABC-type multidrug transport system fused ATPase/permease subunit
LERGAIRIDGVDISRVALSDLRAQLTIIAQDPTLLSGTIRSNLDPFNEYGAGGDAPLWNALEAVALADKIRTFPLQLRTRVTGGGANFSVGERQLFCLARALLRRSHVLILDEASSNVDSVVDALLQRTIRERFATRTVLIIAHRLHTVIECDRVLVLDAGRVLEFDTPAALLQRQDSAFAKFVRQTGAEHAAALLDRALKHSEAQHARVNAQPPAAV